MEKYIISKMTNKNFSEAINRIYQLTDYNNLQYPEYCKWFYTKNIPRIFAGNGEMIFYLDGFQIVGLSILKKDEIEKKICTLLINEEYRKKGYSKLILEDSFDYLGTSKPLITIPEKRIEEFSNIIKAYDWIETSNTEEYLSKEIIFNERKILTKIQK